MPLRTTRGDARASALAHNLRLRADHGGVDIDGGDHCFCIVAARGASDRLPLRRRVEPKQKSQARSRTVRFAGDWRRGESSVVGQAWGR